MRSIKKANELVKIGRFQEAIFEYEEVAKSFPALSKICAFNIKLIKDSPDFLKGALSKALPEIAQVEESGNKIFKVKESNDRLKGKSRVYSSSIDGWVGWKAEFGPGDLYFEDQEKTICFKSDTKRYYVSKEILFEAKKIYTVFINVKNYNGDIRNLFAVVNHKGLKGKLEFSVEELPEDRVAKAIIYSEHQISGHLRIGIGTTSSISGKCELSLRSLEIFESEVSQQNSDFLSDFAKEYIDPELILPPIKSMGNDYSSFKQAKEELSKTNGWQKKSISIIIPGQERADLLRKTLACLVNQNYPTSLIEVIVVDDGSEKDNFEVVFNEFSDKLPLYLARQKRDGYGLARARNLGARSARGDILFFLDSDILLPQNFLTELMAYHHVAENLSVLGLRYFVDSSNFSVEDFLSQKIVPENLPKCLSQNPHLKNFLNGKGENVDWRLFDFEKNNFLKSATNPFRYFGGGHASVSRDKFFQVGGYDENFNSWGNEDQEFGYRLWSHGHYFVPLLEVSDYHQEEISKSIDQTYKLEQNKITTKMLVDKCPHFTVREPKAENEFSIPLFSIYLPAYNVENYIKSCIDSVLSQTYKDFEIVVVDDGSTDQTLNILLNNYSKEKKVKIYSKTNGGIGSASNYALRRSYGEYIVQLDSDDILFPNALESLVKYLKNNPDVECLYTKHKLINDAGDLIGDGWSPEKFDRYHNLIGMSVPHMRCYRRALFHKTSGFDETIRNAVDYDFFLKISDIAPIHFLDEFLYLYRVHSKQTSTAYKTEQLTNHEIVVNRYLMNNGMQDFYAKSINPFEPQKNYILKKDSPFEDFSLNRKFSQPIIDGLELPSPKTLGNDYTYFSEFVKDFYEKNPKNYSEQISIVVPVYNRSERLSRCLAGICQQTYPRNLIEVVVVDDGSSDDVLKVVDKYNKILDLKYVKQHDAGYRLSAARNLGIRSATYRNISIIDCDLIPLPFFIESFMQYLHHFDNVVLLGHQRFVDPTGISDDEILTDVNSLKKFKDIKSENSTMADTPDGITRDWRYKLYEETNYLKNDEFPYRAFSSGHVAYRKKVIEDAGYYDEEFNVWGCEDNEAGYRIYQKGYYFIPVLEAVDLHQEPPSGKNETDREADRLISRELLQSKLPAMRGWFGKPYELKTGDVPLVSVCIPMHNTGHFAIQAIDSVLNQSVKDFEIVIYDDASNDGSLELVKSHIKKFPQIRIIEGKVHRNVTFARNQLIENAKGEFIGFLDSDDLLESDCIKECLSMFRGSPSVGLVCTGYKKIDEYGNYLEDGWIPEDFDRRGLMFGNIFTHFRIFRVRDWNRSRKWSNNELERYKYGEDWDLCLKLAEVADFNRVDSSLYLYRVRQSSITNDANFSFKSLQTISIAKSWIEKFSLPLEVLPLSESNPHAIGYVIKG